MVEIVLASKNKKKIAELQRLLDESLAGKVRILSLSDIGFDGEIEEFGESFEVNSLIKAAVPARLGYIGVADDSGLCVDALGGAPGIYSARYSEDEGPADDRDAANRRKLLRELDSVCDEDRGGGFVCVASLVLPENSEYSIPEEFAAKTEHLKSAEICGLAGATVRGECRGYIQRLEAGEGGFGYDSLFYSPELKKSFAEASAEEKNSVSHRGRAMKDFCRLIGEIISK